MTKPLTYARTAVLLSAFGGLSTFGGLSACGGRELEADTNGGTGTSSSGGATEGVSVSESASVTVSTTITTDPTADTTADPTTLTTDPATTDPDSTGAPETTGGSESCCEAHANPGCEEEAVAICVCKASPECCVFEWAPNCVELAMGDCAATCMGPGESSGGESSTGEVGGACDEVVQLEYLAEDAVLDGGWSLVDSQSKPGTTVASLDFDNPTGSVTWDEIPCDDDWHIWVRGFDFGSNDTFFARLDGGPDPAPIFEVDCTQGGEGYAWRELNWRDPEMGMACEYVEDPWIAASEAGAHQFQLEARDSPALARIIVTNDDAFVPM
jgi:hypothetical protein